MIHTAPNVHSVEKSAKAPAGYEPFCIGTTTSQRMERFTRPLMEREGVRIIIGKGGMAQGTLAAFARARRRLSRHRRRRRGAARPPGSKRSRTSISTICIPESLWRFRIRNFGPLLVGMDSHGGSMFADVRADVAARRNAVLEKLGIAE